MNLFLPAKPRQLFLKCAIFAAIVYSSFRACNCTAVAAAVNLTVILVPMEASVQSVSSEASLPDAQRDPKTTCPNCGAERLGPYCHECGQKVATGRLRLRTLLSDFAAQILRFEHRLPRTIWEMTIRPGNMLERYTAGERRRVMNPIAYLVVGSALSLLTYSLLEGRMVEWFRARTSQSGPYADMLSAEQYEAFLGLMMEFTQYNTYLALAACVPLALLLRLFFWRSGKNIAEVSVFSLFVFGHVNLMSGLLTLPILLVTDSIDAHIYKTYAVYGLTAGFAAYGFFGKGAGVVLKGVAALAISYLFVSVAMTVGLLLYVLGFV